ncbi:MAG: nicotinate (nicotinamide) nucleotide adenylyltransferase [Bacteroidota bacterium]
MKVGLFFGSFNPIHVGHLIITNHLLNETDLEKIWMVVSPQNPLKQEHSLLNEYHRLHLVQLAIENDARIKASDVEFALPRPSYTSDTLIHLQEKYPEHQFVVIMGSDSFQNIHRWKNYTFITKNYPICVYNRPGHLVEETHGARVQLLDAPLLPISATQIRSLSREGKSLRYLVPDRVLDEIERGGYYKK